ncbi:spore germination protein GerPE [Lederbergia citrea]|uniref:Spore germination protein GerPE n=1 Tax=Lederbergia citrea TaxID=2833581 RepID=A0A942UH24_9BACI|nr:spore germination protein GerPE [Lederbergia citrea]MBS4177432.1 spore germination protein GerPE [Lederbergia citrea]MBS4204110.1 spore germination protein GerPE [Lederbergia citrea]MBS4221305.1 spore germination protein GerPE [Lederbergia citrea]
MWKRNSFVQFIDVKSLILTGILEIGDSVQLRANHNILAVQRKQEIEFGNEGNFQAFPIFSEPIPIPPLPEPPPLIRKYNESPNIRVGQIHVEGISTSAIMHIGSTNDVYLESRVLHIRQLPGKEEIEPLSLFTVR